MLKLAYHKQRGITGVHLFRIALIINHNGRKPVKLNDDDLPLFEL